MNRMNVKLGAALFLIASTALAGDWPSMGRDARRSRATADVIAPPLSAVWSQALGEEIVASPVTADGLIVTVSLNAHGLRAMSEFDGTILWSMTMPGDLAATPALHAGRIFLPCGDGNLYCLNLIDGSTIWTAPIGFTAFSSPAVADGVVFVGSGFPDKLVKAFDESTGALIWTTATDQLLYASPAVADGVLYIGTTSGTAYAMNAATGAVLWAFPTGGQFLLSSPMVRGDRVWLFPGYPGAPGGATIFGVNADSQKWLMNTATAIGDPAAPGQVVGKNIVTSSPIDAGSHIVATVRFDYYLDTNANGWPDTYTIHEYAIGLDATTGALAWQVSIGNKTSASELVFPLLGSLSTPAACSTPSGAAVVVASSIDPNLRVLKAGDGSLMDSVAMDAPSRSSPAISNGRVIHVTNKGTVAGLQGQNTPPDPVTSGFAATSDNPPTLSWSAPSSASLAFVVRLDDDGEILHDWDIEIQIAFGDSSATLSAPLVVGQSYAWAVRAQDESGAMGPWSDTQVFTMPATVAPAPVTALDQGGSTVALNGELVTDLETALTLAQPGDVIQLGTGTYVAPSGATLSSVTIVGESAKDTIILGTAVDPAVVEPVFQVYGDSKIEQVTIMGGDVGVIVMDGSAALTNVIVRDNVDAGIVLASPDAYLSVNLATIVNNGIGIDVKAGSAYFTNSIIAVNGTGLIAKGDVTHEYNDYFANGTVMVGTALSSTEIEAQIRFVDPAASDYREAAGSATIDAGSPGEPYDDEPSFNGDRVNMGAFGNTELATPSTTPAPSAGSTGGGRGGCGAALAMTGTTGDPGTAATLVLLFVLAAAGIRRMH